jgi:hypothetical protein
MLQTKDIKKALADAGAVALLDVQGLASLAIDITGTFVGTVIFEYTINGSDWYTLTVNVVGSATTATGATAVGKWVANVAGFQSVRVRCSAFTSGSIFTVLRAIQSGGGGGSNGFSTSDTELPAAAALADATANPTTSALGTFLHGFNGTTWDRLRTAVVAATSTLTGLLNVLPLVRYNSTPPTLSNGQVAVQQSDENANTKVVLAGSPASLSSEYTRPNDSNPYIALDVFADSTSAPTVITFTGAARKTAGSGYITKAQLQTDQKTNTARFRLHLFNAAPTAINDNSPMLTLYANKASYVGTIDFPACATEDSTNSTQATSQAVPGSGNLPLAYLTNADANLYGILETLDAFTPAAQQKVNIKLFFDQN